MHNVCFFGHRNVDMDVICSRLRSAIKKSICEGATTFIVGNHGKFDRLVLSICCNLKREYKNIKIQLVVTSLHSLSIIEQSYFNEIKKNDFEVVFYEVEDVYFKTKIIVSNKNIIDFCDTLICYVDINKHQSGAKRALNYATKKGLKIINLYESDDPVIF